MNIRPATPDDTAAVAELFAAQEKALLGYSVFSEEDVRAWWQTISYETNTWLFEEDGVLVAVAGGQVHGDRGNAAGGVRPEAQGRGLGTELVRLVEKRFTEEGARRVHSWTVAADKAAAELFTRLGYRAVRRFWDMAVDLDDELPEPQVSIEPFHEDDARAFHGALEESFAEHWEHQPEPFEEWWPRQQGRTNFDPSVWFVVRDGDEVAAVCRNEERKEGGYVGALGVRSAWRGRGYGRALLQHSFREFRRRGHSRASLGVDAANHTGATKLYESVGMTVVIEFVVWEKLLS